MKHRVYFVYGFAPDVERHLDDLEPGWEVVSVAQGTMNRNSYLVTIRNANA